MKVCGENIGKRFVFQYFVIAPITFLRIMPTIKGQCPRCRCGEIGRHDGFKKRCVYLDN
ncbi:hypothetical protein VAA_04213 [Vibrio anguillarum 775]|nr:hypothetical protein VAA_04213 [Vibrio anguillarum 775]